MLWNVSQKTNGANTGQETHVFMDFEKRFVEFWDEAKMFDKRPRNPPMYFNLRPFSMSIMSSSLTLRVLSTSPQGNRFTKSMPVRGVPVGGSKMDASIIRYSTFRGLFYTQRTHTKKKSKNINHSMG